MGGSGGNTQKGKKRAMIICLVVSIICIVAVGVATVLLLSSGKSEEPKETKEPKKTEEVAAKSTATPAAKHTSSPKPTDGTIEVSEIEQNSISVEPQKESIGTAEKVSFLTFNGSIAAEDQVDTYQFTAPCDGRYRFEISEMQSGVEVGLYIMDSSGATLGANDWCENSEGVTVKDMKANETYQIQVQENSGFSAYTLTVGQQKKTVDISAITDYTDSVEYTDQRNVYTFTVPRDGRYRFELSEMQSGTEVELYAFDYLGEVVEKNDYCGNGSGITLYDLKAGETYEIQVRQRSGLSSYELSVGLQKETIDVSEVTQVSDSVEYTDQRNVYTFTAPRDGVYRFDFSEIYEGTTLEFYIFNDLGETVASDSYCENGSGLTVTDLVGGETYELQIRQATNCSSYIFSIGVPKETVAIGNKSVVKDSVEYTNQQNVYYFTATKAGSVTITLTGMNSKMSVYLYAVNDLGETVASDNGSGSDGASITLEDVAVGDCYSVMVTEQQGAGSYTLSVK